MQDHQRITPWLDHLRMLLPPNGVMLVGAGIGTGEWVQRLHEWDIPNVTLVEADDVQFRHLQRAIPEREDWQLLKQVIARDAETVTYFLASNAAESGLLEPESLRSLWPNIKTRQEQTRQAIALAELLQDAATPANWLLVDCLPALPIILGAADQLDTLDVIAVRILFDEPALFDGMASLGALQSYLGDHGYRLLTTETSRHPVLGHALFVRDTAAQASHLQQQLSQQAQTHQAQARDLAQAKAASEQLAADRQKQVEQLQRLIEAAEQTSQQAQAAAQAAAKTATEAQASAAAATAAAGAATKQAEERAAQVQQLTQTKAAAYKLAAERQQQIEQLRQTADLAKVKSETELTTQRDTFAKEKAELIAARDANASFMRKKLNKLYRNEVVISRSHCKRLMELGDLAQMNGRGDLELYERQLTTWDVKLAIRLTSESDKKVCDQVFVRGDYDLDWLPQGKVFREYLKSVLDSKNKPLLIDCGANIGASARFFIGKYPSVKVLAIEPEESNVEILLINGSGYDIDVYKGAVSNDEEGLAILNPGNGDWAFRAIKGDGSRVPSLSMSKIFELYDAGDFEKIVAIKIDIEGAEALVFEGECDWMSKVAVLMVELHDWMLPLQRSSGNVLAALSRYGFEVVPRGENLLCFNTKILNEIQCGATNE
jgi:FkbM family methyltransferase